MPVARVTNLPANRAQEENLPVDLEMGVDNVMPVSTWLTWSGGEPPIGTFAVGRDPLAPTIDELVFMLRRDSQARALFSLLTLPIRAAFAKSKWVSPDPKAGQEETDFANNMWTLPPTLGGMRTSSSLFLNRALLALPHGYSAFEVVRQIPEIGPLAGKITLKEIAYRDPRTVTIVVDDHGKYKGFKQQTTFANRYINVFIEDKNSWLFTINEAENPYYGVSMFESAFQDYKMKRKMYFIWEKAAMIAAIPARIGEIPKGATPKDILQFKTALRNMALNNTVVGKEGFKVSAFNGNSNFAFQNAVDHYNTMMATSILAKFLQQEDRQVLIDNGKADASADMFVQMLEAITSDLSIALTTQLMPQFIDANFGTGIYPQFQFEPLTDDNKQAILQIFETLVAQPVLNSTPEFVRNLEISIAERLGFTSDSVENIDYDKVAQEEEQAAKEQQAQEQAQLQAQQDAAKAQQEAAAQQPDNFGNQQDAPPGTGSQRPPQKKIPGGNSPSAGPVVKASQQAAMDQIVAALAVLIEDEDIPDDYSPEPEVIPEAGD